LSREAQYWWLRAMRTAQQGRRKAGAAPPPAVEFVAPSCSATVSAACSDGAGGFYFGSITSPTVTGTNGSFGFVSGKSRRVFRVSAAGEIMPFILPALASGAITGLALHAGWLYVVGNFSTVESIAHAGLFRCDPVTGDVDHAWAPQLSTASVNGMFITSDGHVLVHGSWVSVNGSTLRNIAKISTSTGAALWESNPFPAQVSVDAVTELPGGVLALATQDSTSFGAERARIAALDLATGGLVGWRTPPGCSDRVYAHHLQSNGTLWMGGIFAFFNGWTKHRVARIPPGGTFETFGMADSWEIGGVSTFTLNGQVRSLIVVGAYVYVFGTFTTAGGDTYNRAARFSLETQLIDSNWNPSFNGDVGATTATHFFALANGSRLLAYGAFTAVGAHLLSGGTRVAVLDLEA